MAKPKKRSSKNLSVYSNLSKRTKTKRDARKRRRAEYLATLPKHPVKRVLYRLHPKRFFAYWFSREGAFMALKIAGVGVLLITAIIGLLFAYYRQEIAAIRPTELNNRVQTTVSRYLDRNGKLLWEDKGTGSYKLVVESKDIADYMKDATIAIEDKDFEKHAGFSLPGIIRAGINNMRGGEVQGASTLTQQLVKQVFFADEAGDRSLGGIPRKIKETILAVEVERAYTKDQILTMYLNESSYGGRRNGVQSASQTYFGKDAKKLNLAESALLASIPQQPTRFNPYMALESAESKAALLKRQHTTLNYMAQQGMITTQEAEAAKKIAILDEIKPEADQYKNTVAPHFVQMVKSNLEAELGKATVGAGGLTIKTTLDIRAQKIVDRAIVDLFNSHWPTTANFDNGAATAIDTKTGQILAMRGSRDYRYPDYGAVNASTSWIQPGSSIKPLVYAALLKEKPGPNFGSGSILPDNPLPQDIYTTDDGTSVQNFDNRFRGPMKIRNALAESRNIPAILAMRIAGRDATLDTIHSMGDLSYCTDGVDSTVGLAAAIGGCGLKQTEHTNAFATIARMGVYKEVSSVLEVRNADGQVIKKWKDEGKQVIDPQITYILADILSDDAARSPSFGGGASGLNVPGVRTFTKTGTSNAGTYSKDLWMMSTSPKVALGVWVGNHVPLPMSQALSSTIGPTVDQIMGPLHTDVYQKDGSWSPGDWFNEPSGIQHIAGEIYPSWYNRSQSSQYDKITFDRVSKRKATDCTPDSAKVEISVQKYTDPVTERSIHISPMEYDVTKEDNVHKCDDVKPYVNTISYDSGKISASVGKGTHPLDKVEFSVNGRSVGSVSARNSGNYSINYSGSGEINVSVKVVDSALYEGSSSDKFDAGGDNGNGNGNRGRGPRGND